MVARRRTHVCCASLLTMLLLVVGGCTGTSQPFVQTTFLRSVDLVEMTDEMAQSFAADEVVGQRTSADEPWIVSIERLRNRTNELIPTREKWLYIARLRAQLAHADLTRNRSIIWVMPPERWGQVAAELNEPEPMELRMKPTHLLTAEFFVLTSTFGGGRSDTYHCSFQLIDLRDGVMAWNDAWEVKRAVSGLTYD